MAKSRRLSVIILSLVMAVTVMTTAGMTAEAGSTGSYTRNYINELNGGVAAAMDVRTGKSIAHIEKISDPLLDEAEEQQSRLVMANVKTALNIRSAPGDTVTVIGRLYKDCGGTIIERQDGWTKLQSGNIIGWASDEYLLFDEDAKALANEVGKMVATIDTETLRVRKEPSADAGVHGLLPKGEIVEVLDDGTGEWVCIDYEGKDGYVSAEYITLDFQIDTGETMEEIKAREATEREAKRHVNYGEYTTDADTTMLLAALIQCEAGGELYEGQVAVGAVVMNRVRSSAYPNSIHGVIYASGQFTPAMTGKLNQVYEAGKIRESCIKAAKEALSGVSNVGDLTHFRRNNGREGLVIGNHVFY